MSKRKKDNFEYAIVYSANILYLIFGIITGLLFLFCVTVSIYNFIKEATVEWLFWGLMLFALSLIPLCFSIYLLKAFNFRKPFKIYRYALKEGTRYGYIQKYYKIIDININYVYFIDSVDEKLYDDYHVFGSGKLNWESNYL